MSSQPISLALLWHMHQPFYKDMVTGEYILPWVRLHAVKDYYDMVAVLDRFPEVKMNFNLVPSLLTQIEDYVNNKDTISDIFLNLTRKDPADLTLDDRIFLLQNFFMANWDNMVNPYPRYHDLLLKRGRFVSPAELAKVARRFSTQELMDLQVWFNLTWFGFIYKNEDPVIKGLIAKGRYFTKEDKQAVIDKQWEVMGKVIPKYKELEDRGQIEITTTPFYHPILPLLCDSAAAKEAMPYVRLPETVFRHPEDAEAQIKMAVEFHEQRFGRKPRGMWPSEGSVSEAIIPLIGGAGLQWAGTDEGILERTIAKIEGRTRALSAAELYQPYLVEKDGAAVALIFRNHFISDQIGFVYYRWKVQDAVTDFTAHLNNIRISLPEDGRRYLVSVILDGENAWEYYRDGGKEFFEAFYGRLAHDPMIKTVRVADYLEQNPPQKKAGKLYAGSWISNNFKIWIGHQEDNLAWDYLSRARLALQNSTSGDLKTAWQEIYVAEGSDWCWWYGDDHSSENDAAFDALFRRHLKNVYNLIGRVPPKELEIPIKQLRVVRPIKEPAYLIQPLLDGEITNYYEWLAAGYYDITRARGAMHQIETLLRELYYGFSLTDLYVRLGVNLYLGSEEAKDFSFAVIINSPADRKAEIAYDRQQNRFVFNLYKLNEKHEWELLKNLETFGIGRIIEVGIPFDDLAAKPGQKIEFTAVAYKDGQELERWPRGGGITVAVPTESYEEEQWFI
ncbi:MAG: glycoside hydrolase family 57 protein [Candidatus Margulisbacteria bacterium]|nr:glycoside hydrolase family 57 protein [Candidatus Margulisiibacteriota bacterium]